MWDTAFKLIINITKVIKIKFNNILAILIALIVISITPASAQAMAFQNPGENIIGEKNTDLFHLSEYSNLPTLNHSNNIKKDVISYETVKTQQKHVENKVSSDKLVEDQPKIVKKIL